MCSFVYLLCNMYVHLFFYVCFIYGAFGVYLSFSFLELSLFQGACVKFLLRDPTYMRF